MGKLRRRPKPQHDAAYIQLREQLKAMRVKAGLTQVQLADVFDRPHTFVHKVESGDRRIDPVEFTRWCRACGIAPGNVLDKLKP
ncbi:MAG: helix-turn-helix domain-containing protein [Phycisphaeraceae bacterium]|nr:helix-turn-helix domain-containing protein [Phycisphaeraceae bacterium]